jgi:hypothetical protein
LLQNVRATSAAIFRGFAPGNAAWPSTEPSFPSWTVIFARFLPISPVTITASASSFATFAKPASDSSSAPVFARPRSISRDFARVPAVGFEPPHHLLADDDLLGTVEFRHAGAFPPAPRALPPVAPISSGTSSAALAARVVADRIVMV